MRGEKGEEEVRQKDEKETERQRRDRM